PQDRVPLRQVGRGFFDALPTLVKQSASAASPANANRMPLPVGRWEGEGGKPGTAVAAEVEPSGHADVELASGGTSLRHGSVVIAAITSCTNTSNPSVMIAAGLVAKRAVE